MKDNCVKASRVLVLSVDVFPFFMSFFACVWSWRWACVTFTVVSMLVVVWGEVQRLWTAGWEVHEEALALGPGNPKSEPLLWSD